MGNIKSVQNALAYLGYQSEITDKIKKIEQAKFLILPGVGAAGEAMKNLKEKNLIEVIKKVTQNKIPLLGICLGMQILFSYSEENDTNCLDLIKGKVRKFKLKENYKIPQIGWNNVKMKGNFANKAEYYYFVHSYYCDPEENVTIGETDYGIHFTSMIQKDNIIGCQFHPEKSGEKGLQLLKKIITLSL